MKMFGKMKTNVHLKIDEQKTDKKTKINSKFN